MMSVVFALAMYRRGLGALGRGCLVTLAVAAMPINATGGERHAGTVLAVAPDTLRCCSTSLGRTRSDASSAFDSPTRLTCCFRNGTSSSS